MTKPRGTKAPAKKPWRQINRLTNKHGDQWPEEATAGDLDVTASFVRTFKTLSDCIRAFAVEEGVTDIKEGVEKWRDPVRRSLPGSSAAKYKKRRKQLLANLAALADVGDCNKVKESAREMGSELRKEMRAFPDIIDPRNSPAVQLSRDLSLVYDFADFYADPSAFFRRSFHQIDDDSIPFLAWPDYFEKWGVWAFLNPVAVKGFAFIAPDEQRRLIGLSLDPPLIPFTDGRGPGAPDGPKTKRAQKRATVVKELRFEMTAATPQTDRGKDAAREMFGRKSPTRKAKSDVHRRVAEKTNSSPEAVKKVRLSAQKRHKS